MWRPIFKWGQSSLEAGRLDHFSILLHLKLFFPDVCIFKTVFSSLPSSSSDSRVSWDIGVREIREGWCLKYMLWVHSAAEGFTVGSEPADHVSNCRVDEWCPVNKAYLFLKDGKDATGAGTQGPCRADLLHPIQRETSTGDCSCQDPEHHWLPKDGLDSASCCSSASWP